MHDDFPYTKGLVDGFISGKDEFTLGELEKMLKKNNGIGAVAEDRTVKEYVSGLVEIGDLNYDCLRRKYSKNREKSYENNQQ